MASLIYNLAFSPRLIFLNLEGCAVQGTMKDIVEAIYKLLRISASIEILNCSKIPNLIESFEKDFHISLGEVKSLKYLDI